MLVSIPTPLHSYTGGRSEVDVLGASVAEVTSALDASFPGLRFRIVDEQDHIRPHIKIFVNRRQVRTLDHPLAPSDEVAIVQSFSGG